MDKKVVGVPKGRNGAPPGHQGVPAHEPTDDLRECVAALTAYGTTQEQIAQYIGITVPTLHKYYRRELDFGALEKNLAVGNSLFRKAVDGDTGAMIWWSKTRMGWKEGAREERNDTPPFAFTCTALEGQADEGN
jgi:hypothetical protein